MIYVLLVILLIVANGTIVVGKIYDSIHLRGSKALGGKPIIFPENHPLYQATMEFKEREHETWYLNKDGLKLQALYYSRPTMSDKTVVLTHGFGATHNSLNIFGQLFYRLGFNVLMPDNRAAGISEGKYMSFGFYEQADLRAWIDQLNEKIPDQKILLFGASMGAATVLQTADKNLPTNVLAMIEDSAYTETKDIIQFHATKKVGKIAKFLVPILSLYSKLKMGFSYQEASPLHSLENAQLPMLFVVSGKDNTVPPFMGRKLYDSYQGPKDFYENQEGIHIRAYNQDPRAYEEKVNEFLKKYFKSR